MFALDPRLEADGIFVADWSLSRVLLMNDRRFPWLILVPRLDGLSEIHELPPRERGELVEEIARASQALSALFTAHKLNVAALGNAVRQLHVHVVVRRQDDAAQPGLVWAAKPAVPYGEAEREAIVAKLRDAFAR
jgi:diadenosine tetraphosphate (Ap4A) HIT family hydrolase